MTCIVGFVKSGKVYIGGDSAGVSGLDYKIRNDKKVFKKYQMVFGSTASFRMGQILQYSFDPPNHESILSDMSYLCGPFIDALIKCCKEKGYATVDNNEVFEGTFLLGYKGNLYSIHGDFQIAQSAECFDACGCGDRYALGAMQALTHSSDLSPETIIESALQTAESFSAGVRGPFNIVHT